MARRFAARHFSTYMYVTFSKATTMSPIKKYSSLLECGALKPDQSQFNTMLKLQNLYNKIHNYCPEKENQMFGGSFW